MNISLSITLLFLTLIHSYTSMATPIRYKVESRTKSVDKVFESDNSVFDIKEHFGVKAQPWLHYGIVKNIIITAKSENGAGQAIFTSGDEETASQKIPGHPTNFETSEDFHEISFDYTNTSQYPKWILTFFDDKIKVDKVTVIIDKPIRRIEFKSKCSRNVYGVFIPGIKLRVFTESVIEYGYQDERRAILERTKQQACDLAIRRCDKYVRKKKLLYCK